MKNTLKYILKYIKNILKYIYTKKKKKIKPQIFKIIKIIKFTIKCYNIYAYTVNQK